MKKPLITIATVTYNAAPLIAGTLRNIRAQSWPQVEELIIDGASTDRTVAIARKELPWARIISSRVLSVEPSLTATSSSLAWG